jgi:ribosomal protein S17
MAMQNGFDGAVTDHDACSWLVKYVKTKHNLPNYDKAVKFSKNINYIDENNNITETGRSLFEFSQFNGDHLSKKQKLF